MAGQHTQLMAGSEDVDISFSAEKLDYILRQISQ